MTTASVPHPPADRVDTALLLGLTLSRSGQPAVLAVALRFLRTSMLAVADNLDIPIPEDHHYREVEIVSKLRKTSTLAESPAHVNAAAQNAAHALDRLTIRIGNERISHAAERLGMSPQWHLSWGKLAVLHTHLHRLDRARPADAHIVAWFSADATRTAAEVATELSQAYHDEPA